MCAEKNKILFTNIPEDKIPNCWKDVKRLNVLFAPFRDKSVNHVEWDSKYSDWKQLINLYVKHNRILTFTLTDLDEAFTYNKRVPSCLKTVLEEMRKEGILQLEQDFMKKTSDTWTGWMTDVFIKQPIHWSFTKVRNSISNPLYIYVHVVNVQEEGKNLLLKLPKEYACKVIDVKQLENLLNDEHLNNTNLHLILHYLNCQKKVSLKYYMKDEMEKLLLIKADGSIIDDKELNIYVLEQCEEKVHEEIHKLEAKSTSFVKEAKTYITKGNKNMAKHMLKRKHENEFRLSQKYNTLYNIQMLLSNLQDAGTNLIVKDTYKKALDSLSELNKKLSVEEIDDIMADIEESVNKQNDIDRTLAESIDKSNTSTDVELEKELDMLLAEDGKESITDDISQIENEMAKLVLPDDKPLIQKKELNTSVPTI